MEKMDIHSKTFYITRRQASGGFRGGGQGALAPAPAGYYPTFHPISSYYRSRSRGTY